MFHLRQLTLEALPCISYSRRKDSAPKAPGVYFIADAAGDILYIGQAVNLSTKFISHHYAQLLREHAADSILWFEVTDKALLDDTEAMFIKALAPKLNITHNRYKKQAKRIRAGEPAEPEPWVCKPLVYRPREAAAILGVPLDELERMARSGKLRVVRVGAGRKFSHKRYLAETVEALARERDGD